MNKSVTSICLPSGWQRCDGRPAAGYYDSITGTNAVTLSHNSTCCSTTPQPGVTATRGRCSGTSTKTPTTPPISSLVYNGSSVNRHGTPARHGTESTWPRSLGVGDNGSDYSDLHQAPPTAQASTARGAASSSAPSRTVRPESHGLNYRGRMRMAFYMKNALPVPQHGALGNQQQFVDWHRRDTSGDVDNTRNDRVYNVQNSRNAFADRPEWVWALFGDSLGDARSSSPAGTGRRRSSETVDLGLMIGRTLRFPRPFPSISRDRSRSDNLQRGHRW